MGRWAQRQRGGGGINTPLFMLTAAENDVDEVLVTFSGPVVAAAFTGFPFTSNPSGFNSNSVTQSGTDTLLVGLSGDITTDTTFTYNGSVANTAFPATVTLTH